ncbi:MAG: type II toxin-antitoxin system RelB/DinJ family antitoxin [Proteobacteria bacterium]|nr:type II toxin-antitoxin system RelB/DinJ family antitoxin [Pseudomonadota bacterium]
MSRTAYIRARVEPELKKSAEQILKDLGITASQAVTMLYKCIQRKHGWPLELKIPNEETQKIFEETDKGVGIVECSGPDEMFKK